MLRAGFAGLVALMLITSPTVLAAQGPRIKQLGKDYQLSLPPATKAAIDRAVPGFNSWRLADYHSDVRQFYLFTMREAPWAVIGDFNGDGVDDVAMDGYTATKELRIVVLSHGGQSQVLTLEAGGRTPNAESRYEVLQFVAPGKVGTNFSDDTKLIFTDAFNVYFWEKAGTMYYWEGDHFSLFGTSD
jgi:hypothetical protein